MLQIEPGKLLAFVGTTMLAVGSAQASAQPSFDGRTIRLVIGSTSGSPTDLLGRQFAPHIAKRLPGNPALIVENRPGAGSAIAANYIYGVAKPDGLTIGLPFGIVTQGLIGGEGIRFEPAKLQWLGAVSTTQIILARKDINVARPRDLLQPSAPLVLSVAGSNTPATIVSRLFLDMIGAKYKTVSGYPGNAETVLAVARGEANLTYASYSFYLARRDAIRTEGIMAAILQTGDVAADGAFRRNRQFNELPTMAEAITEANPSAIKSTDFAAFRSVVGAAALQFAFILPPATQAAIVNVMRRAVGDGLNDPETHAAVQAHLKADYDFLDGAQSQKLVEKLHAEFTSDKKMAGRLSQLIAGK